MYEETKKIQRNIQRTFAQHICWSIRCCLIATTNTEEEEEEKKLRKECTRGEVGGEEGKEDVCERVSWRRRGIWRKRKRAA